ncbi:hypothetical protein ES706_02982 [subsurface metagenome]
MKRQIVLYDDGTKESERIGRALRREGVEFTPIPCPRVQGRTPAIASQLFMLEGVEEIRNYFLPELDESAER